MMKRFLLFFVIAIFVLQSSLVFNAFAQTIDMKFYSSNNILFYNPEEKSCAETKASTIGDDPAAKSFNFFIDKGLSDNQSAAIVGVLRQASDFNPKAVDIKTGAYGIAQWRDYRLELLTQNTFYQNVETVTKEKEELDLQLEYLWSELVGSQEKTLQALKSDVAAPLGDLVKIFATQFTLSSEQSLAKSAEYATTALSTYITVPGSCAASGAGDFTYFSQKDPKWGDLPYGTIGPLKYVGCGPTSMAMVVATFADKSVTPIDIANLGADNGSAIPGIGTAHLPLLNAVKEKYGLEYVNISSEPISSVVEAIQAGSLVYMGGQGPAPFTAWGHVVIIRAVTADGMLVVADPYRGESDVYSQDIVDLYRGSTFVIKERG